MLHSFTKNYRDLSTEAGFQFDFYCDCCGNGFKSTFVPSTTYNKQTASRRFGRIASAIGTMLGGDAGRVGYALERGSDVIGDNFSNKSPEWRKEYEKAFDEAQKEVTPHFLKCPGCNNWVCPDCWNEEEGLCTGCAPREASVVAQAHSQAMRRDIENAAHNAQVWKGDIETRTTLCPKCGKPSGNGKFCNNCGTPLTVRKCPDCGADVAEGVKFCGECGKKL
jgi:Predicted amidophosphoribosyltransferases